MTGVINHFRGSRRRKKGNQMIVRVDGIDSKEKAEGIVGKSVSWTTPGKLKKVIKGKISASHGNSGSVKVHFEKGMPGQSLGKEVKVE